MALAGMVEIASNLFYALGNGLAVDAWESLQRGQYEAYRDKVLKLQEKLGCKIYYAPVLARMICESIERAEKRGERFSNFPVVDGK